MGNVPEIRFRLFVIAAGTAFVLAASALWSLSAAWADAPDGQWQFFKPIILPNDLPDGELVEVELDPEIYAYAQPGLGDVRLTATGTDGEREIPYQLLIEAGDQRRAAVPVEMQDLGHIPNDYTSFILRLQSEGDLHSEVDIQTSSVNFQRRVAVSASDDGETWRVLQKNGAMFNLSIPERGFSAGDTSIRYPSSSAQFLRIQIFDEDQAPLAIQGAVVLFAHPYHPFANRRNTHDIGTVTIPNATPHASALAFNRSSQIATPLVITGMRNGTNRRRPPIHISAS